MSEFDCRKCRDWKTCYWKGIDISAMWFGYEDIRWCPQQVCWLLKFADILHQGEWPVPDATVAGGMRGKSVTEAGFAKVMLITGELDTRLERTGLRGRLLAAECKDRDMERVNYLSQDAKDALYYVVGWRRRKMGFSQWRKQRKYRSAAQGVTV